MKPSRYVTSSTIYKIRLKRKAWIKYKITLADANYEAYVKLRNEATKAVRASKYSEKNIVIDRI